MGTAASLPSATGNATSAPDAAAATRSARIALMAGVRTTNAPTFMVGAAMRAYTAGTATAVDTIIVTTPHITTTPRITDGPITHGRPRWPTAGAGVARPGTATMARTFSRIRFIRTPLCGWRTT